MGGPSPTFTEENPPGESNAPALEPPREKAPQTPQRSKAALLCAISPQRTRTARPRFATKQHQNGHEKTPVETTFQRFLNPLIEPP